MGIHFFSLDYLVHVIQKLHTEKIVSKSYFYNRTGVNIIISRLLTAGLIRQNTNPIIRLRTYRGAGRYPKLYQLNCDYRDICVGDLVPLLTKIDRHEEHICHLMAHVPLSRLAATKLPDRIPTCPKYSAAKMLSILFSLNTEGFTRCDDMENIVSPPSHRRAILSDLVKTGVVVVQRGSGYKLKKSLSRVAIKKLLPLMYSRSARKNTYNVLIYLMRDMSVDQLNRSAKICS